MDAKTDTDNIIIIGGLAVVAYLAYQAFSGGSAVVNAIGTTTTAAGNSIGGWLYQLFNPGVPGTNVYYTATLPDGTNTAVPSNLVNADGTVNLNGTLYQMYVDPTITSGVNKTLVPL